MREVLSLEDKNILFSSAKAMHDEIMTYIEVTENTIRIEYGKLAEREDWSPYKKAVVTYFIDESEGYSLELIKVGHKKNTTAYYWNDPEMIKELNKYEMTMYMFSLDLWGNMTLHFNIWKKHTARNAELQFKPITIQYDFVE